MTTGRINQVAILEDGALRPFPAGAVRERARPSPRGPKVSVKGWGSHAPTRVVYWDRERRTPRRPTRPKKGLWSAEGASGPPAPLTRRRKEVTREGQASAVRYSAQEPT